MPVEQSEVVVVGAGPSGLATAACLERSHTPYIVIEASDSIASRWRRHYDRLHLHTPKRISSLPFHPMPDDYPVFPSRQQVVDYLQDYAEHFAIAPRLGERVSSVRRMGDDWRVTAGGNHYDAKHLVMATGYNHLAVRPRWPGQDSFRGLILHSSEYKSGAAFANQNVLVVGAGNTGAELALDLVEQGARHVYLCVRGGVDAVPREFLGVSILSWIIALQHLPLGAQDLLGHSISWVSFGDLAKLGLSRTKTPVSRIFREGRIPLIDVGTIAMIRKGRIRVVGAIERFDETGLFAGAHLALDAVVLATGYRSGLGELITEARDVLDERALPRRVTGDLPGLHFVGFRNPPTGILRSIAKDAHQVAAAIRGAH